MTPFVSLAALCEEVVQDEAGALHLRRIVDTFVVNGEPTSEIPVNGVLSLKSGDVVGNREVRVRLRTPSRIVDFGNDLRWIVRFAGYEQGATVSFRFQLPAEPGLFWLDVLCDNERLTSVPFRVVRQIAASPADSVQQAS